MFGIVRPCRHGLCAGLFKDWLAHLCGLCLALRDEHGHAARLVTSYDGLLVSVLTEAQRPATAPRRQAGPCALRGFKRADVVEAEGVRLAAAVSLILAAGRVKDHVEDGDGVYARGLVAAGATRLAARWSAAGGETAAGIGFDPAPLAAAVEEQARLERRSGLGVLELTAPTESAVAAAFGHTAVLADRPHNRVTLEEAGRYFGRLAHLLDAVEDLAADRARGAYNPLVASGTSLAEARRLCDDAVAGLRVAVADLDLERRGLVTALLVKETDKAVKRTFAGASDDVATDGSEIEDEPKVEQDPGGLLSLLCGAMACCTCGLYRPPWDEDRHKSCTERCDTGCCDGCSSSGDCGSCCDCCSCDDGCCCDCSCDC